MKFQRFTESEKEIAYVDDARTKNYYLEGGLGFAMPISRAFQWRNEVGFFASLGSALRNYFMISSTGAFAEFGAGGYVGTGLTYRLPGSVIAFGFNYRWQGVPYAPISEHRDDADIGYDTYGSAHSFALSTILRFDHDD